MKIKFWLISSYLLVMILPVAVLLLFVQYIQSYDEKQEMVDYFEVQAKLDLYENMLDNPDLYKNADPNEYVRFQDYAEDKVIFTLYNNEGLILFSTDTNAQYLAKQKRELIYQNLYQLQANYHTFDYKRPVFEEENIVGFYEISFLRHEWVKGVKQRTNWAIALYLGAFILIYVGVLFLLKRKLFQPLKRLMAAMSLFAKGEKINKLPRKKDEIGELISHFEAMQKEIEDKNKALLDAHEQKQYMIAAISHDLKTPLTTIRISAESLLHKETAAGLEKGKLDTILNKADYIHQLIDDLAIYNIMQSSQYHLETVCVDGQEFFEMVLSDYDELVESYHVSLCREIKVMGTYQINTKQLLRLFDNLLVNALHHTTKDGRIWACVISTKYEIPSYIFSEAMLLLETMKKNKQGLWIIVQNEGETIPEEEYEKLFDALYQRDPSRSKMTNKGNRGSGLGLSIAKMIMEKHGGEIYVRSTEGKGCTFLCYLPEDTR